MKLEFEIAVVRLIYHYISPPFPLQYPDKALYIQLCYYRYIFDWDYALEKVVSEQDKGKGNVRIKWCLSFNGDKFIG